VIVAGDFNRRFDRESADVNATDMWDVITGASTSASGDDVNLTHVPKNKKFKCRSSLRPSASLLIAGRKADTESDARRTRIPTQGGQHSDDCGQRVRAA
jgi:hypothetical protein